MVCARRKEYIATSSYLSDEFQDGSKTNGPASCQATVTKYNSDTVKLTSCRSNTTILIRRVGIYLTFNILSPFEIVNASSGLCHKGCPLEEQVDYPSFFHEYIHQNDVSGHGDSLSRMSYEEAMLLCSKSNVTDFYYDSCVFDLLTTGDRKFRLAAKLAMQDALSMSPRLRLRRENSVVLRVVQSASISAASRTLTHFHLVWYVFLALLLIAR